MDSLSKQDLDHLTSKAKRLEVPTRVVVNGKDMGVFLPRKTGEHSALIPISIHVAAQILRAAWFRKGGCQFQSPTTDEAERNLVHALGNSFDSYSKEDIGHE